jgi:hypothetical protein
MRESRKMDELIKPVHDKQKLYIITAHQWEEYQTLKNF